MCRFALYLGAEITMGSLVTEPSHSIIHQSYQSREREEPLNGDGFGVAWYVPEAGPEPALFRSVSPAWSNPNLRHIARVSRSRCILAHVRAASPGLPVTQLNCHPFISGPFAFMHNGTVAGFQRLRRRLVERLSDDAYHLIAGSTDSEHVFALFVDAYHRLDGTPPLERMTRALEEAIGVVEELRRQVGIEQPSHLNFAVSDGQRAVITRFTSGDPKLANTLYCHVGQRYVCEGGMCRMVDPDEGQEAVIVASERLSDDPGWDRVEVGYRVTISEHLEVATAPIGS